MGFNEFLSSIFGNKSTRDMKEIQPWVEKIKAAYPEVAKLDNDALRAKTEELKAYIHDSAAEQRAKVEELKASVEDTELEETGLHIKNLKYFGSQPWPYPSGIMIGFTADYESGNIKLQQEELNAGAFYTKDNLPEIPKKLSLARKLIDAWLEEKDHL